MTDAERRAALEAIAREVAACSRCRLHQGRTRAVPGEGSAATEVVFVGEGPGEQEDRQGRPFVGASGQLLTELIASLGWRRSDVFITNVVKCRPPGNRDPQPDEIAACAPFLRRQLETLDPAVVVTVGKHSLNAFRAGERIGRVHGTSTAADPATGATNALVFSMYHPAFALYQGSNRQTLFADMAGLPGTLLESRARRDAAAAPTGILPPAPPSEPTTLRLADGDLESEPLVLPADTLPVEPPAFSDRILDDPALQPASVEDRQAAPPAEALAPVPVHAADPQAAQLTLF